MTNRQLGWGIAVTLLGALGLGGALVASILWLNRSAGEEEDVGRLVERLADGDSDRCREAAKALGDIGPDARAALPALRALLGDDDARMRRAAATALWKIDRQAEPLLRALWEDFRKDLADCAGRSPAPPEDLDDGRQALSYGLMGMRSTPSGYAWEEGQAEATALALARGLRDEDARVRRGAALLLLCCLPPQPPGGVLIPALARSAGDTDLWARGWARGALKRLGPAGSEAAPTLRAMLEVSARRGACGAAALVGAARPPACVLLAQGITLEEIDRQDLAQLIQQIEPEAPGQAGGKD